MEPSSPPNMLKDVVSFHLDVRRLAWSARKLRMTNNQDHLIPIKTITKCLLSRVGAFEADLQTLAVSQDGLYIPYLLQSCKNSGYGLLDYLQKIVADAQTTGPRTLSTRPNFEWDHVNNLIRQLRELGKLLRGASNSGSEGFSNGDTQYDSTTLNAGWTITSFESGNLKLLPDESSSKQVNNAPLQDFSAHLSRDWMMPPSIDADVWSEAHFYSNAQQDTCQTVLRMLDSDQESLASIIYQLKHEWSRLFCQQPLPALVLLFIMEPPSAKLHMPVTFRPVSYQASLLRLEGYLKVHCGDLLQIDTDNNQIQNARRYPFANSVEYEVECVKVRYSSEMIARVFALPEIRNKVQERTDAQQYDALEGLSNACTMVLKSTDPSRDNIFHRYLMYLAHVLRNATHFSPNKIGLYLDRVGDIMRQCQLASSSPSVAQQRPAQSVKSPYHLTPLAHYRSNDSLHLKPEMRSHADIYTFAAEEALLHPYTDLHVSDLTHRFAIAAHALCSWTYRSNPDPSLQVFIPTLVQRKATLRHLLTTLVPPECSACNNRYSLWWEVMQKYNKGVLRDPMDLMAVFLGASRRPDMIWAQSLRPMVEMGMGWRLATLKEALEGELRYAVAPEYFQYCLGDLLPHPCT